MPYFDRFDICAAYYCLEAHYHVGGILWERPSNRRRKMSTACQLVRIGYSWAEGRHLDLAPHTENAQAIYDLLVTRYNLSKGE